MDYNDCDEIDKIANEVFGVPYLYPYQNLVVCRTLENYQDGHGKNQIVLLPTGSGKTLCFMVPSFLLDGCTLIIYPLLALINDQKRRLNDCKIDYACFTGGMSDLDYDAACKKIESGCKIILTNPETLQNRKLIKFLCSIRISHIVIDEAHCVSEWGKTFRSAYLKLKEIIAILAPSIATAFTATASPYIMDDIKTLLFDSECDIIQSPTDRSNIHYSVCFAYAKKVELIKILLRCKMPALVFCSRRKDAEDLSRYLAEIFGKNKVRFYHAGLEKSEKTVVEKWFFDCTDGILCSTNAYGMGVSKDNIKTTIHYTMSNNLESYCQEAGRAGRDGSEADSIVLWSYDDTKKFILSPKTKRQKVCGEYVMTKMCRRQFILDYFGDENECVCSGCDNCNKIHKKNEAFAYDAAVVIGYVKKRNGCYIHDHYINVITDYFNIIEKGKVPFKIWENTDVKHIISQLKDEGILYEKRAIFYGNVLKIKKHYSELVCSPDVSCSGGGGAT